LTSLVVVLALVVIGCSETSGTGDAGGSAGAKADSALPL
jgi:hypothetical protein